MYHDSNSFRETLAAAQRAQFAIDDVLPVGSGFDFERRFMPESLARVSELGLSEQDERTLNQIRGHEYLSIFGLVEEFILPFVLDHVRPHLAGDDWRVRAFLNFAAEEAKHIQLFKRFHDSFTQGFGTACQVIGPPEAVGAAVLAHDPLSVALVILQIEWMTQAHYLGSVRDDRDIDDRFRELLRVHWMEESGHARLDTLMVEALAEGRDEAGMQKAVDGYFEIAAFLDGGLKQQAEFNVSALETHRGANFEPAFRERLVAQQHQSARWTYIGSGATHPKFRMTLGKLSQSALARVDEAAPAFA